MDKYKILQSEVDSNNVKSAPTHNAGEEPRVNKHIFDKLPELIVERYNMLVDNFKAIVNDMLKDHDIKIGNGDMLQAVYDADGDNIVDKAKEANSAVVSQNVRGFWIAYGDAEGNNMDELFIHYYEDEETGEIVTQIT